jgi:hypothetical protein
MNSTYKYYGTTLVIFEFHSFDLQASVADDLQVMHFISEDWVSLLQGASGSCWKGLHLTAGYNIYINDIITVFVVLSYPGKLKYLNKLIDYAGLKLVVAFVISNHI